MKYLRWAVTVLAGFAAAGATIVYVLSEAHLGDVPTVATHEIDIPEDSASIERGRHIARTRGCFGCHGQQLEGRVFEEQWDWTVRGVAPNLAAAARRLDTATLERIIRHGIGADGRALWSMPSYNWVHLSDRDLGSLIAFLRSAPVVEQSLPRPVLGWRARWAMAAGRETHMAKWALDVPPLILGEADDRQLVFGEYLAMTTCNECHGFDLRGDFLPEGGTPDLAIVTAYDPESFRRLMDEGVALGGRDDLGLMSMVAKDRFAYFSEAEREAIYAFLRTLPARPVTRPDRP